MARLFEKIKRCRFTLVDWSQHTFRLSKPQLQEKQKMLEELCLHNRAENLSSIKSLKAEITNIIHQDELFWRQRSRSIWLPTGDKNTKYFHNRASQRRRKNHISEVFDTEERWCTSDEQIAHVAESYFQELFSTAHPQNIESVLESVQRKVTSHMNESLTRPYIAEEVRLTLFQMYPSKSPGSDGMLPCFFQKY